MPADNACASASVVVFSLTRSVSFLRQRRTADGRPYGTGCTKYAAQSLLLEEKVARRKPGRMRCPPRQGRVQRTRETDCTTGIPYGHHASVRTGSQ